MASREVSLAWPSRWSIVMATGKENGECSGYVNVAERFLADIEVGDSLNELLKFPVAFGAGRGQ